MASELRTAADPPCIASSARETGPSEAAWLPIPDAFGIRAITVSVPMRFDPRDQ